MDPAEDPFAEPPKNVREYLGDAVAAAFEAAKASSPPNAGGHLVELYGGALDGATGLVSPGDEFGVFAGRHFYRFCPRLTVQRGRETWVPILLPDIQPL